MPPTTTRRLLLLSLFLVAAAEEETEYTGPSADSGDPYAAKKQPEKDDTLPDGKTRKELAEGKSYCEYDNCYELLGVTPESGPIPIKRAYRRLAAEWHPDKCASGDIAKCREVFPKYANAYEVLSNSEMRKNYDYVLANPYEFPGFYLRYSRPKYAPKSDLRTVLVLTLLAAAGVQYLIKHSMYEQALAAVKKDPRMRYNERVKEIMTRMEKSSTPKKLPSGGARGDAGSTKHNKTKAEEAEKKRKAAEEQLELELASELPPPPSFYDNIAVDAFKAPLTLTYSVLWVIGGGMREPGYRTRKALGMSAAEWADVDEAEQAELVGRELWISENLEAYEEEIAAADAKGKGPKSGKEKREQRARKKQLRNPSTMVIED